MNMRVPESASYLSVMSGAVPSDIALHLAVLAIFAVAGFYIALVLTRRRLLK